MGSVKRLRTIASMNSPNVVIFNGRQALAFRRRQTGRVATTTGELSKLGRAFVRQKEVNANYAA
jgi:hypothetical protein